jgi:hypothetical protein
MRLFRWLAYCLLGYLAYEFYEGLLSEGASRRRGGSVRRDLRRALDSNQGRLGTLTGPGVGELIATEDPDGASSRHLVGRGVVRT